jgi:signal transduction histidine kinase
VRAVGQDITHFVAIKQDISERLRAEETRARLEEQLHAAQKLDALGTLAGGVAHDFNNILAVILGNVELAAEDVGPAHVAVGSLDEIRRAARRAQSLVQRILAFSREEAGPHERVALRQVVEDALAILRPAIPATVALTATCAEDTPTVEADATQIEQVLLNVCTNAWHALPESAGRIDVRVDAVAAGEGTANPTLGPPERWARVRVTDNGSGMDPTTRGRIFEPFFTTKPPGQGTGLGLSVVHGIVKAHGGVIEVASEPGGGTTFTIYLPAAPALEWNGSHHGTPPSDR